MDGSVIDRPLLSSGNIHTGFCNCAVSATVVGVHPAAGHVKYTFGGDDDAQAAPQSCRNSPTPKIPFAPKLDKVFAATPPALQAVGGPLKFDGAMIWMGMLEATSSCKCTSTSAIGPHWKLVSGY